MPPEKIEQSLVDEVLALGARERQSEFLRAVDLLNAEGLDRLLDFSDWSLGDDPGKARRLAELCAYLAGGAAAPAAVPRANYILSQACEIDGDFDTEFRLIKAAHDGYTALGMDLEALRTNVGLMVVHLEQGRYQQALDTGRFVLDTLEGKGDLDLKPRRAQYHSLAAPVHLNRGGCYEYMGRYDEALDAYAAAEECYHALGMPERVGEILSNRGAILLSLGRGTEALEAHRAATAIFERTGLNLSRAKALANIGEAHLSMGNYRQSLGAFEQARSLLEPLDALADESLLLRDVANAYLALNLHAEALAAYREANGLLRSAGMVHDQARVLWGIGSALIARSELEDAEEALREAAALFAAADNAPLLSGVMLEQASLLEAREEREAALATARQALELLSEEEWPVQLVYAHMRVADLLKEEAAIETHLREARRLADRLALPQLGYRLNERLGRLRRIQGHAEEAEALLVEAVEEIERLRGTVNQDMVRASFLRDKTAAYEELLLLYLARADDESVRQAFVVAERAKSRALVDLLTGVAKKSPDAPSNHELEGRIRALQADLNAIYSGLLASPGAEEHPASLPDLRARAVGLEEEITRLRLQASAAGASPDPFEAPVVPDPEQQRLPSDTALLAYHTVGDEIIAFVSEGGNTRVVRNLGPVSAVQRLLQRLAVQWDRFGMGRDLASRHMPTLERSARRVLSGLYDLLVVPVEPLLKGAGEEQESGEADGKGLAIVPHGILHQVPFHALFDGGRYLVERFEISYALSATVYALSQREPADDPEGALVFGAEDPSIPAAATEARAVARHLPEAEVLIGEEATLAMLQREAPRHGTLHLACHGLFRSDNPMFSSLELHDGWLMAIDAMNLELSGALVVLSACESGRGEVIGGDEVIGLPRAFLGAGAATLVVSLWLVQDETTAELMGGWYERLRDEVGRAAGLRAAQLEMMKEHPHPYYWAPFVLIGKR